MTEVLLKWSKIKSKQVPSKVVSKERGIVNTGQLTQENSQSIKCSPNNKISCTVGCTPLSAVINKEHLNSITYIRQLCNGKKKEETTCAKLIFLYIDIYLKVLVPSGR